jgi:hypothetical protein
MSFEIDGFGSSQGPEVLQTVTRGSVDFGSLLRSARQAVAVAGADSVVPTTPPPEVSQAIGTASQAYEELNATGHQLHFTLDRPTGALAVELRDMDGNPLSNISASEALRIAGGKSLT